MALIQQTKMNLLQLHSFQMNTLSFINYSTLNRTGKNKVMSSAKYLHNGKPGISSKYAMLSKFSKNKK